MCLCRCVRACVRACVCTCVSVCVCVLIACPIPALLLCALQKTLRTSRALHATNQVRQPVSVFAVSCACMLCCVSCVSQSAYTHTHIHPHACISPLSLPPPLFTLSLCVIPGCLRLPAMQLMLCGSVHGFRQRVCGAARPSQQQTPNRTPCEALEWRRRRGRRC